MRPLLLLAVGLAGAIAVAAPVRAADCLSVQVLEAPCTASQPPCLAVELPCES